MMAIKKEHKLLLKIDFLEYSIPFESNKINRLVQRVPLFHLLNFECKKKIIIYIGITKTLDSFAINNCVNR